MKPAHGPVLLKGVRPTRFVVGIDLGTTNTAVAYLDLEGTDGLRQFPVAQLVSAGELGEAELLPSLCYLPGEHELPDGALDLPWAKAPDYALGELARLQGALVPGRLIASVKSWLAHAGVDRTRGILPWGGDLGDKALSPVAVSRLLLEHVCNAWNARFGRERDEQGNACRLEEQQVILTVPASFDEVARELTLIAARDAGLRQVVLLEEPLAAFYAWLAGHENDWTEWLAEGEHVLVVDVGGGTTDFSLIALESGATLRRMAVGEHLLLGGDNMDMALARQVEAAWGVQLDPRSWSRLCQECRRAKEMLLADSASPAVETISVAGVGSSVVAGTRSARLRREEVLDTIYNGFFPAIGRDAPPPRRRAGIREMGLPYAADPAISTHLLHFLRQAAGSQPGATGAAATLVAPRYVLFNGGALLPQVLRDHVVGLLEQWCGQDAVALNSDSLHLAVSRGAAYYGGVRLGQGIRVRGGIARSYYMEVGTPDVPRRLCVMPRDTPEGVVQALGEPVFRLKTNVPVRFPLYASATRLDDRLGAVLPEDAEGISRLPPLHTVLRHGRKGEGELGVTLSAMLNEIGTLELWCATRDGQHRFPLSFDLRAAAGDDSLMVAGEVVATEHLEQAFAAVDAAVADARRLPSLPQTIEQCLGVARDDWGLQVLRTLADGLLAREDMRTRTPRHEARWLNLCGFCLRPGFGAAGDDWRLRELWKLWHAGPVAPRDAQVAAEWWVCWRRVAGGLRPGQQQQIGSGLWRELLPRGGQGLGPRRCARQEAIETWRCAGALEALPVKEKLRLLETLLTTDTRLDEHHFWVMARIGARQLFHGPQDAVIPAARLEPLLPRLWALAERSPKRRMLLLAVSSLCRLSGIRGLDVPVVAREKARLVLMRGAAPDEWLTHLQSVSANSQTYQKELIADSLPLGLSLADS